MLVLCETYVCVMLAGRLYFVCIMVYACDCGFLLKLCLSGDECLSFSQKLCDSWFAKQLF